MSEAPKAKIHVSMCETCGCMPRYKGMEGYLKQKGYECSFEYGETGTFEVYCDGQLIWSKKECGEYPIPPQILEACQKLGK